MGILPMIPAWHGLPARGRCLTAWHGHPCPWTLPLRESWAGSPCHFAALRAVHGQDGRATGIMPACELS
ncbi:MAG: hypothetical protein LBK99_07950 [Opitutaceae bacterium]|nr:hypothetical protein [Opitutaceae bacterium]